MTPQYDAIGPTRERHAASLTTVLLVLLLSACNAAQGARLTLPEPSLPTCIQEDTPKQGEAVGRYEFAPQWLLRLGVNLDTDPKQATRQALVCASDTARSLREAVSTIRLNNRP